MTSSTSPTRLDTTLALETPYSLVGSGWTFADALFLDALGARRPPGCRRDRFPAAEAALEDLTGLGDVLFSHIGPTDRRVLVEMDDALVLAGRQDGFIAVIAAGTAEATRQAIARLRDATGAASPPGGRVPVTFWWLDHRGPRSRRRIIDVPAWADVRDNYAAAPAAALDGLTAASAPPPTGRLLLWHGPPGTGKSFALRALLDAWRGWCAAAFITDPDQLFGGSAGYLAEVLTSEDHGRQAPWRLLILEDAGDLMALDARSRAGHGLSRLLNLADGLLGQGSRTLVLITTNEPLGKLHPAVHRAGRCWMELEFPALPAEQANRWLAGRGATRRVTSATALADLFTSGSTAPGERPPFGFAA